MLEGWLNPQKPQKPKMGLGDVKIAVQNILKTTPLAKSPSVIGNLLMGEPPTKNTKWGKKEPYQQKAIPNFPTPTPNIGTKVLGIAQKATVPTMDVQQATKSGGVVFTPDPKPKKPAIATKISPTNIPTPSPTPDPRLSWDNMADMVIREGNKKGYHGETLAKQKALESAYGTSKYARERYNYGGLGAYDSNPDNAWSFKSPEDYLQAYFDLIEKDSRYVKAFQNRAIPEKYLSSLKEAGYASDPDYVWKVLNTPLKR